MKDKKFKIKDYLRILKKVMPLRTLIIIIILLASNTFAWFVYNYTVQGGVQTHVRAWKITFVKEDEIIEHEVNLVVPDIYPGMTEYHKTVSAENESELAAQASFVVLKARVLDEEIITDEGAEYYHLESSGLTSDDLVEKLRNDYPFVINLELINPLMEAKSGISDLDINASWLYDSGDDELDTFYGEKASEYNYYNPTSPSIELDILVRVVQVED